MSRKSFAVFSFAALAMGVLLLFGLSSDVSATTVKLNYSTAYDCGGADGNEGTTADNSCSTAGLAGRALGATADVVTNFDVRVGHSNYANTRTVLASPAFSITPDPNIPNGAFIGTLTTQATLSLLGAACVSSVPVQIPLFDATTDITNTIDWAGDGSNLTLDGTANGLADGIDKYPSFLNVMFNNQKPLARYYGYTVATGAIPTQLNFVIFAPGVLAGTASAPGMPKPDQEMNASLGFINYVALNNPAPGQPAAPITITDICTPLNVTTRLLGKTAGEGRSIAAVGPPELSAQCTGALLGKDSDGDGNTKEGGGSCNDSADNDGDTKIDCADFDCQPYCDDGCIVVTDTCGDGIDNDFDGKVDEYCVGATGLYAARTRSTNPAAQGVNDACPASGTSESGAQCFNASDDDADTLVNDGCPIVGATGEAGGQCANALDDDGDPLNGIYVTGTHLAGAYLQGGRDADNDGIENPLDSCPTIADGREVLCADALDNDGDTKVNDGCPRVGTAERFPSPDECADNLDSDIPIDGFINDGCPAVQVDADGDGLGGAVGCDPNDAAAVIDQDGDTFTNRQDNCPLVVNANQLDLDSNRCANNTNEDVADDGATPRVNDGCPAVGAAETACADAVDSDVPPDGVVNDGCPLKGGISEFCVVSNGDFGPCSDGIGDACDAAPLAVDGDYDKDFPRVAVCIGAADGDGDGWCDATETALGSSTASAASVPEYAGLDYPIDPAPQSCSNNYWYASGTDPIGDGAPVDDDGDTLVNTAGGKINDGCPAVGPAETACDDVIDNDGDTNVNDGCPQVGAVAEVVCNDVADSDTPDDKDTSCAPPFQAECTDALDTDGDTNVNDGCPTVGVAAEDSSCVNAADDDGDTEINDGCPAKDAVENPACVNNTDDDADTLVNDGCPVKVAAENPATQCADAIDDDADTRVNDGCPAGPPETAGVQCDNAQDDDADTVVNDGCAAVGAAETQCTNLADDDADGWLNDGCAPAGGENPSCANSLDDDGDTRVNDGCPTKVAAENPACANNLDDDADTIVNDGCLAKDKREGDWDQDGVPDATDNCPDDYNPDQTNSDTVATGGGNTKGDACDPNDDGDGVIDTAEWIRGSDTKHPFSPFMLDLDGNGSVQGADASGLKLWIGTAVGTLPPLTQVCLP